MDFIFEHWPLLLAALALITVLAEILPEKISVKASTAVIGLVAAITIVAFAFAASHYVSSAKEKPSASELPR